MAEVKRPVLCWHGGKWLLADWVIGFFPAHEVYVEPYGGAASVLLRKPRVHSEVYNDLDEEVVNLFRVLQGRRWPELVRALELTPFHRREFELAYERTDDPIERARRLVVRSYMGFGSASHNKQRTTGFRVNTTRRGISYAGDWMHYPANLAAVVERLRGVIVECVPALDLIPKLDAPHTLFYVDPPYIHSTRSASRSEYSHEMTDSDHRVLAAVLRGLVGYVVLSGYNCQLYEELYNGWASFNRNVSIIRRYDRTETIWLNPRAYTAYAQAILL